MKGQLPTSPLSLPSGLLSMWITLPRNSTTGQGGIFTISKKPFSKLNGTKVFGSCTSTWTLFLRACIESAAKMSGEEGDGFVMDREEIDHLMGILRSMNEYEYYQVHSLNHTRAEFESLDQEYKALLPEFEGKLQHVENCVYQNQLFLHRIISMAYLMFPGLLLSPLSFPQNTEKAHCIDTQQSSKRKSTDTTEQTLRRWRNTRRKSGSH